MNSMNNLIKNGVKTIDSRDLANMMGMRHAEILLMIQGKVKDKNHGNYVGLLPTLLENSTCISADYFIESSYKVDGNKRTYPCYLVTKKGCELLANKLTGKKGILFTQAYVDRFNEMEQVINQPQPQFKIPQTYIEALEAHLNSEKKLALAEAEKQLMLPMVESFNEYMDAENCLDVGAVAKTLDIGRNDLFKLLRKKGLIQKESTLPYRQYEEAGYFKVITVMKYGKAYPKTLVTPKGHDKISKLVKVA